MVFGRLRELVFGKSDASAQQQPATRDSQGGTAQSPPAQQPAKRRALEPRLQPLLQNARHGTSGGVQGLDWYVQRLQQDGDGDVADEFLHERGPAQGMSQRAPGTSQREPGVSQRGGRQGGRGSGGGQTRGAQAPTRRLSQSVVFVEGGNVHVIPDT